MAEDVRDGLIAGLAHALSNRISTISVVGQTIELGDGDAPQLAETISQEVVRLEELLRLMRLVPADGRVDPLHVPELARDLTALARHHRELRIVEVEMSGEIDVLPVLADRSAFLRALLAAVLASARAGGTRIAVRYANAGTHVTFAIDGASALAAEGSEALTIVAQAVRDVGASWSVIESRTIEITLPTLAEARRRSAGR